MSGTNKHKCVMCPNKGYLNIRKSTKCTNCSQYFHSDCAKKVVISSDRVIDYCCGINKLKKIVQGKTLINKKLEINKKKKKNDHNKLDEIDASKIDNSFVPLWNLFKEALGTISSDLSTQLNDISSDINYINTKVDNLLERVDIVEDTINLVIDKVNSIDESNNAPSNTELIIKELKDRQSREKNIIITCGP